MTGTGSILLVEPYLGGSHAAWVEGVQEHAGHPIQVVSHPARFWTWRMRGSAVTLAEACADLDGPPAAVVASDMVDLAAFRTFARRWIGDAPVGLYFHESQLTYPTSPQMTRDLSYAYTNWTSALAADVVWFNSTYHRDVFFDHLPRLLDGLPDHTHTHRITEVAERAQVLEVGVDLSWAAPLRRQDGPLRILWNHRWEHDKDPASFAVALDALAGEGRRFELVLCGATVATVPTVRDDILDRHGERIVHAGHADVETYRTLLHTCDVVVSTARQEFFGVAVVEAVAAGCMPLLPRRLAYPSLIPERFHGAALYDDGGLLDRLRWAADRPDLVRDLGAELAPEMSKWGWGRMGRRYERAFTHLLGLGSGTPPARDGVAR